MSRLHAALPRIGGPGAVSWWAFWISLADRLVAVNVQPINLGMSWQVRVVATVLAQLAMFAPLVLLRFTLLRDPDRPRPWVALGGFAFACILRGAVIDQLFHTMGGLPLLPGLRIASGFLPTFIPLVVIAYVVSTLQERRRELNALHQVRGELEQARANAEVSVQEGNEELVRRVRTVLEAELGALSGERPAEVVGQLQRTATDVVRPLSHELASSFAEREGPEVESTPQAPGWRQIVADASLERPLQPLATILLLSGVWLPAATVFAEVRGIILLTLPIIWALLAAGNALLRRALPRAGYLGRLALVVGTCLAVGIVVGWLARAMAGSWVSAPALQVAVIFYVTVISSAAALVGGVLAARGAVLQETAGLVEELRTQVVRTRQLRWFHQRALARALHGPVQTAVTAAALRLDDAAKSGSIPTGAVEAVRVDLLRSLDVLNASDEIVTSFDASIARIVGTWEGLCVVTASIAEDARLLLERDTMMRALAVDIVTEAVSNSVRHGRARNVTVDIAVQANLLHVMVYDDGAATPMGEGSGLGSALLDECALAWSLESAPTGHHLSVTIPTSHSGAPAAGR